MPWNSELPLAKGTRVYHDLQEKTGTITNLVRKRNGTISRIGISLTDTKSPLSFNMKSFMKLFSVPPEV